MFIYRSASNQVSEQIPIGDLPPPVVITTALVSVVCAIVFLSGCAAHYGTIGRASQTQLAPDCYRVAFFPTGYISWDLAYREALLRCAELTIENGYRYFGVVGIENYSSVTNFAPPGNSRRLGFYNAYTAYNPPPSSSITFWPLPDLTIKMLRDPIPGVSLDARAIWQKTKEWRQVAYAGLFFGGK